MHEVSNFVEIFVKLTKTLGIELQLRFKELGLLRDLLNVKIFKSRKYPPKLHQRQQYFIIIENILSISDIKIVVALTYFFVKLKSKLIFSQISILGQHIIIGKR